METEEKDTTDAAAAVKSAEDAIIARNFWLTRIRWLYSSFLLVLFGAFRMAGAPGAPPLAEPLLISLLAFSGNLLFIISLRRHIQAPGDGVNRRDLFKRAALQLDFDFAIILLYAFFTGGFASPAVVLFIFYVLISSFFVYYRKAFRNTIIAVVIVAALFFSDDLLEMNPERLASLIGFIAVLIFAYLISGYLSLNLRDNETQLREQLDKFHELSVSDRLTGLYNQTHFFMLLNLQFHRSRRYGAPFALIMFDVDNFKNYNDNNGHIQGSETLKKIAEMMTRIFRGGDILAKYGGDEFVIILPQSDKVGALLGAERLRETVECEDIPGAEFQPLGKLTLSLGISAYPEHGDNTAEILDHADKALYMAKHQGRNRTVIYSPDMEDYFSQSDD